MTENEINIDPVNRFYTFSICYNQNDWFRLLGFIRSKYSQIDGPLSQFIKLSFQNGPHIQYTVSGFKNSPIPYLEKLSEELKTFVEKDPSRNVNYKYDKNQLFLNFPNNTVHHGVIDFQMEHKYGPANFVFLKKIYSCLTKLILDIFNKYGDNTLKSIPEIFLELFPG